MIRANVRVFDARNLFASKRLKYYNLDRESSHRLKKIAIHELKQSQESALLACTWLHLTLLKARWLN